MATLDSSGLGRVPTQAEVRAALGQKETPPAGASREAQTKKSGVDAAFLAKTELFRGTTPAEIATMIGCLGTSERHYDKGEYVLMEGDRTHAVGIVLKGSVRTESSDAWGNTRVMGQFGPGQMFGEAFAALGDEPLLVSVMATQDCSILFVDVRNVVGRCPRACSYHTQVSANLLASIARKTVAITRRLRDSAPKSIRGKLMAYLSTQSKVAGSREFDIPFKRQQLADYLGVDRSALSSVISSLQHEGVIEVHRSHFKLLR